MRKYVKKQSLKDFTCGMLDAANLDVELFKVKYIVEGIRDDNDPSIANVAVKYINKFADIKDVSILKEIGKYLLDGKKYKNIETDSLQDILNSFIEKLNLNYKVSSPDDSNLFQNIILLLNNIKFSKEKDYGKEEDYQYVMKFARILFNKDIIRDFIQSDETKNTLKDNRTNKLLELDRIEEKWLRENIKLTEKKSEIDYTSLSSSKYLVPHLFIMQHFSDYLELYELDKYDFIPFNAQAIGIHIGNEIYSIKGDNDKFNKSLIIHEGGHDIQFNHLEHYKNIESKFPLNRVDIKRNISKYEDDEILQLIIEEAAEYHPHEFRKEVEVRIAEAISLFGSKRVFNSLSKIPNGKKLIRYYKLMIEEQKSYILNKIRASMNDANLTMEESAIGIKYAILTKDQSLLDDVLSEYKYDVAVWDEIYNLNNVDISQLLKSLAILKDNKSIEIILDKISGDYNFDEIINSVFSDIVSFATRGTIDSFLSYGASINVVDKYGATLLIKACRVGDLDKVRFLLEKGADVNIKDASDKSALIHIIESMNFNILEEPYVEIIKLLLEKDIDLNAVNKNGETALILATKFTSQNPKYGVSFVETAKILLQNGINIHLQDNEGNSALSYADKIYGAEFIGNNNGNMIRIFEEHQKSNINNTEDAIVAWSKEIDVKQAEAYKLAQKNTELISSIKNISHFNDIDENLEKITSLLNDGADINAVNERGETALILATKFAGRAFYSDVLFVDVIEFLLENGADINIEANNGKSALDYANEADFILEDNKNIGLKEIFDNWKIKELTIDDVIELYDDYIATQNNDVKELKNIIQGGNKENQEVNILGSTLN